MKVVRALMITILFLAPVLSAQTTIPGESEDDPVEINLSVPRGTISTDCFLYINNSARTHTGSGNSSAIDGEGWPIGVWGTFRINAGKYGYEFTEYSCTFNEPGSFTETTTEDSRSGHYSWISMKTYAYTAGLQYQAGSRACTTNKNSGWVGTWSGTNGWYDYADCGDQCGSPVVLHLGGGQLSFTAPESGVRFDIDADGDRELLAWTPPATATGFLALDRNNNGVIDDGKELFGDHTILRGGGRAVNGYDALREFDLNDDAVVDAADAIWANLRIWVDSNHDGETTRNELLTMETAGVLSISTAARWTARTDIYGNQFRYAAPARLIRGSTMSYDVFLRIAPNH